MRSLKSELGMRPVYHRKQESMRWPCIHNSVGLSWRAGHPQAAQAEGAQSKLDLPERHL